MTCYLWIEGEGVEREEISVADLDDARAKATAYAAAGDWSGDEYGGVMVRIEDADGDLIDSVWVKLPPLQIGCADAR